MIVILQGGKSSEREVSIWTADSIADSLDRLSIKYVRIDAADDDWLEKVKSSKAEKVIIALHGPFGEDGTVQTILEKNNIKYTGSDSIVSAIAIDKIKTKEIVAQSGIKTPQLYTEYDYKLPVVIKPNQEGSSFGVTIVKSEEDFGIALIEANKYDESVLIEEYIEGRELTCGVIDVFGKVQVLPLVEIKPKNEFFNFESKYQGDMCEEICPAEIDENITKTIQSQSAEIFKLLNIRQYCRIDWIVKDDIPYFLEVNTLPGMTKTSLINKELKAANIEFDDFISKLMSS